MINIVYYMFYGIFRVTDDFTQLYLYNNISSKSSSYHVLRYLSIHIYEWIKGQNTKHLLRARQISAKHNTNTEPTSQTSHITVDQQQQQNYTHQK